jgi:hypothetical protein
MAACRESMGATPLESFRERCALRRNYLPTTAFAFGGGHAEPAFKEASGDLLSGAPAVHLDLVIGATHSPP